MDAKQPHGTCGCYLCEAWRIVYVRLEDGRVVMHVVTNP